MQGISQGKVRFSEKFISKFTCEVRLIVEYKGKMKRSCMEVLKFSSAEDILRSTSQVCALWRELSNDNELWYELLGQDCESGLGPKESYRETRRLRLAIFNPQLQELQLYCCSSSSEVSFPLPSDCLFTWNSAHVFLDSRRILTCGHQRSLYSSDSFLICIPSQSCQQIANMTEERVGHGIIAVNKIAYVFGGYGPKKSCESLGLDLTWRKLPQDMTSARAWFTPCADQQSIYLCGGGVGFCERWDIISECFFDLPLKLPSDYCSACSAYYKNCVVIVTNTDLHVYNTTSHISASVVYSLGQDTWANSPAVIYRDVLYIERDESGWRQVKLAALKEMQEFRNVFS